MNKEEPPGAYIDKNLVHTIPVYEPIPIFIYGIELKAEIVITSVQQFDETWAECTDKECPKEIKSFIMNHFMNMPHILLRLITVKEQKDE